MTASFKTGVLLTLGDCRLQFIIVAPSSTTTVKGLSLFPLYALLFQKTLIPLLEPALGYTLAHDSLAWRHYFFPLSTKFDQNSFSCGFLHFLFFLIRIRGKK